MSPAPRPARVYRHRCAGLVHELERPLAGLDDGVPADGRLEVRFLDAGAIRGKLAEPGSGGRAAWLAPPVEGVAALSPDGRAALVDEAGGAALLRRLAPFASALQARGILHASAVRDGDAVAAFLGESGAGKSTLARALARLGLAGVADDLLPLRPAEGGIRVPLPGRAGAGRGRSGRLAGLFFLERRSGLGRIALDRLSPADALAELTRNGFGDLASRALWRSQFDLHARLAREVAAFRLGLPAGIERLEAAAAELAERIRSALG